MLRIKKKIIYNEFYIENLNNQNIYANIYFLSQNICVTFNQLIILNKASNIKMFLGIIKLY
jgi:hypothetical protein